MVVLRYDGTWAWWYSGMVVHAYNPRQGDQKSKFILNFKDSQRYMRLHLKKKRKRRKRKMSSKGYG